MKKKLIIFGNREIAELATYYFESENEYIIEAYTVDDNYID